MESHHEWAARGGNLDSTAGGNVVSLHFFLAIDFVLAGFMVFIFLIAHAPRDFLLFLILNGVGVGLLIVGFAWIYELCRWPTLICLEADYIVVTRGRCGLSRMRTMNSRNVSNLRASYYYDAGELGGMIAPGVVVDYLGRERRLVDDLAKEEAEYLVDQIKSYYQNLNINLQAELDR